MAYIVNSLRFAVAHLGARRNYDVPRSLYRHGMLDRLFTDITGQQGWPAWLRCIPNSLQPTGLRRLLGRRVEDVPGNMISTFDYFGWNYVRTLSRLKEPTKQLQWHLQSGTRFCNLILEHGLGSADGVHCFNTAGLELLMETSKRGLLGVVEQTIAPASMEQYFLEESSKCFPGWQTSSQGVESSAARERETAEWAYADLITCGSQFVVDGIGEAGGPTGKCVVVPYAVDTELFPFVERANGSRRLRVLTVGAVGLRKGTPSILAAAKELVGVAEFHLVGGGAIPNAKGIDVPSNVKLVGSVPRSDIRSYFEWADVYLLPSVCEGSAVSTYEAMLSGLPVICTKNTGSLVRPGVDGMIVEVNNPSSVRDAISELARNRELVAQMQFATQDQREFMNAGSYGLRLTKAIRDASDKKRISTTQFPSS